MQKGAEVPWLTYQQFSNLVGNLTDMIVEEENWQPIIDAAWEMRSPEDYSEKSSTVKNDFLRKWHHIFGFEESYGYLSGSYVRDKDGVNGAFLICEMFSYYATRGISLLDKLEELFGEFGYCLNTLHSYEFEGSAGFAKMQSIMQQFRSGMKSFGGKKVRNVLDYSQGLDGLPKSDVLKYLLDDNCSVVVRPSGTEPKLKAYISVSAPTKADAEKTEIQISGELSTYFSA